MRNPARILIVDDSETNVDILATRLGAQGYEIVTAFDGDQAIAAAREHTPDLLLLDVMMPKMDGFEVCRILKNDPDLPYIPIILVTAKSDTRDVIAGLDSGGDEYLTKPVDHAALVARVRSILRTKELHDTVQDQARELQIWNTELEDRVRDQLDQIERMDRLKRFLSPKVVDLVMAKGGESLLESHRSEITIVFCDLRGFTAFTERTEHGQVIAVLQDYHRTLGQLVHQYEGTIEHFAGDGLMVLFNDPLPCPDHTGQAIRMALEMQREVDALRAAWHRDGHDLGFGIGISRGMATLGRIGFEGRYDYAANGTSVNLASRLCDSAKPGQIVVSEDARTAVDGMFAFESLGAIPLKGLQEPAPAYNVKGVA